jgi:surfactin synthase thioesterase subunit
VQRASVATPRAAFLEARHADEFARFTRMGHDADLSRWLLRFPRPNPRLHLICLPYAGGGTATYRRWPELLPPEIEVCAVQLPGREQRINEAPMTDTVRIAELLVRAVARHCEKPFAFFGHSMGAGVAYATALASVAMIGTAPVCFMASARRAPHLPSRTPERYCLNEKAFIAELKRLNGTPPAVLESPELMSLMLPIMRSDFQLAESYVSADRSRLPCPVVAFGGKDDRDVSFAELEAWREVSDGRFRVHMLDGDHFFINTGQRELIGLIASALLPLTQ